MNKAIKSAKEVALELVKESERADGAIKKEYKGSTIFAIMNEDTIMISINSLTTHKKDFNVNFQRSSKRKTDNYLANLVGREIIKELFKGELS